MPAGQRQHGRPPGGIRGALLAWPDGDISVCRRDSANRSRRWHAPAQNFCEDFAPRNEAARLCWERGANRAAEMSAAGHAAARNLCEDFAPRDGAQGFARSGEQIAPRKCRRRQMAAQNFCEDFAPRNEAARLCWERGANRAAEKVARGRWRRGISVKILLPGTKQQDNMK